MAQRIILGLVLIAFLAHTAFVLAGVGFGGFFATANLNAATRLMFFDLVITLILISIWMHRDAERAGRRFWPYALVTLVLGSAGPLAYLLVRSFASQCAMPSRQARMHAQPSR